MIREVFMLRKSLFLVASISVIGLLQGCGQPAPDGFPAVRATTVKVVNGGTPIANVSVILVPEGSSLTYVMAGKTEADGTAKLQTSQGTFIKTGVPDGTYRIMLNENPKIDMPVLTMEEQASMSPQQQQARQKEYETKLAAARTVPVLLGDANKTPLKMTVDASNTSMEIDISKYLPSR